MNPEILDKPPVCKHGFDANCADCGTCRHGKKICEKCIPITDAAKRMCDNINGLLTFMNPFELRDKWLAVRLSDGGYDGTIYDTRADAINHQLDERFCAYFCFRNCLAGANVRDCAIYLEFNRKAYDAGMRMHEFDAPQLIIPNKLYDKLTRG
jgi:hypothetical protein